MGTGYQPSCRCSAAGIIAGRIERVKVRANLVVCATGRSLVALRVH